jgi:hypothetical protein
MHSFHRSRGRILFEVVCVLAVSASCVAAWMQTGASALLAAAAVAALYGLVHLFDMRRRNDAILAVQPENAVAEAAAAEPVEPPVEAEQDRPLPDPDFAVEAELVEPPVARQRKPRRAKSPRKAREKAVEQAEAETSPFPDMAAEPEYREQVTQIPIAPLFDPDPLIRQQRTIFGRKAG